MTSSTNIIIYVFIPDGGFLKYGHILHWGEHDHVHSKVGCASQYKSPIHSKSMIRWFDLSEDILTKMKTYTTTTVYIVGRQWISQYIPQAVPFDLLGRLGTNICIYKEWGSLRSSLLLLSGTGSQLIHKCIRFVTTHAGYRGQHNMAAMTILYQYLGSRTLHLSMHIYDILSEHIAKSPRNSLAPSPSLS